MVFMVSASIFTRSKQITNFITAYLETNVSWPNLIIISLYKFHTPVFQARVKPVWGGIAPGYLAATALGLRPTAGRSFRSRQ